MSTVLRHHSDLLRERSAPHRAHLHDHGRPTPWRATAAWRATTSTSSPAPTSTARTSSARPRGRASRRIELADRVVAAYHELRDRLGFSYDDFIRTTEERHHAGGRGDHPPDRGRRRSLHGAPTRAGTARPARPSTPRRSWRPDKTCPVHGTPVEWKSEENVFFRLSKYQQPLLDWYDRAPGVRAARDPAQRGPLVRGVRPARPLGLAGPTLEWGIPFPGHPGQTVYVWLDALTNYISALGFGRGGRRASTGSSGRTATSGSTWSARTSCASTPSTGRPS